MLRNALKGDLRLGYRRLFEAGSESWLANTRESRLNNMRESWLGNMEAL
jgi:hypothetical protein